MSESIYYDIKETLTHNCLFNFVCGNRSGGKTYGFKKWAIEDWIKRGNQFGYVRRYKTEVDKGKLDRFFDDVCVEFPEWEFKVDGNKFMIRKRNEDNVDKGKNKTPWEVIGYSFVLSIAVTYKSVPFPKITKIAFDEFLIEKGSYRYLPDEVNKFNDLYNTIARPGSDHPEVIVFFLSNAISFTNIYFLAYDIKPPKDGKRFYKVKGKDILLQMVSKEGMVERQKSTRFGNIISGSKYEEYAFENKFYLDDDTFIERKSDNARHLYTMIYNGMKFGVWCDYLEGLLYVSEKYDPYAKIMYAITQADHSPNTMLIRSVSKGLYLKQFIECYRDGCVRFENMKVKNCCYEIFKLLSLR